MTSPTLSQGPPIQSFSFTVISCEQIKLRSRAQTIRNLYMRDREGCKWPKITQQVSVKVADPSLWNPSLGFFPQNLASRELQGGLEGNVVPWNRLLLLVYAAMSESEAASQWSIMISKFSNRTMIKFNEGCKNSVINVYWKPTMYKACTMGNTVQWWRRPTPCP